MSSIRVAPGPVVSQGMVWIGAPGIVGEWHDPANWINGSPDMFDLFVIDDDGFAELSVGTYVATSGEIAHRGTGQLIQIGGSLRLNDFYLGRSLDAHGTYRLEDGSAEVEDIWIGAPGQGDVEVNGGVLTVNGSMYVGGQPGRGRVLHTGGMTSRLC